MDIKKPHDKFFQESFKHRSVAMAYVKHFMPESIHSQLDFETFALDNQSYINEALQDNFSDIVYNCHIKEINTTTPLKIALLFEHKSYVPQYPLLQVLEYMLCIWRENQKQQEDLMLIIPIVIYHGAANWKHRELSDFFPIMPNFLQPYFPNFQIHLTNISQTDDETIKAVGANFLTNTFLALKYSRQLTYVLKNIKELFIFREQFLNSTLGDNQFTALFIYLSAVTKFKDMKDLIIELPSDLQEKGLSAYEKAILEGEERSKRKYERLVAELNAKNEKVKQEANKKAERAKREAEKAKQEANKKAQQAKREAEKAKQEANKKAQQAKREAEKAKQEANKKAQQAKREAEKAKQEAAQQAIEQTKMTIVRLLQMNVLSFEMIAISTGVTIQYVELIKKTLDN